MLSNDIKEQLHNAGITEIESFNSGDMEFVVLIGWVGENSDTESVLCVTYDGTDDDFRDRFAQTASDYSGEDIALDSGHVRPRRISPQMFKDQIAAIQEAIAFWRTTAGMIGDYGHELEDDRPDRKDEVIKNLIEQLSIKQENGLYETLQEILTNEEMEQYCPWIFDKTKENH